MMMMIKGPGAAYKSRASMAPKDPRGGPPPEKGKGRDQDPAYSISNGMAPEA
jgi:hypothetical protein